MQPKSTWIRLTVSEYDGAIAYTETQHFWDTPDDPGWITIAYTNTGKAGTHAFTSGTDAASYEQELAYLRHVGWTQMEERTDRSRPVGEKAQPVQTTTYRESARRHAEWTAERDKRTA